MPIGKIGSGMFKDDIVILIAAYNESENIAEVVSGAKKYAARVLVVDDGSSDATVLKAKEAGAIVISHQFKKGKGAALKTGFQYVVENFKDFKVLVTIDGDGQHCPDDIGAILEVWPSSGTELVLGARNYKNMPWDRRLWNRLCSFLVSLIIKNKISDSQSGLRLISRKLVGKLVGELKTNDYRVESEMIFIAAEKKIKIAEVSTRAIYDKKFSLKSLGGYCWRAVKIFGFIIGWPIARSPRAGAFCRLVLAGIFLISFPHLILKDWTDFNKSKEADLSVARERNRAFKWLENNSLPSDIILSEWTQGNNIVAMAKRQVVVSSKVYPSEAREVYRRYLDLSRFFFSADASEAKEILKKYQVSWVFIKKDFDNFMCRYTGRCLWPDTLISDILSDKKNDFIRRAYESEKILIYKVINEVDKNKNELVRLAAGNFDDQLIKAGFSSAEQVSNEKIEVVGLIVPHHYPYVNYLLADLFNRVKVPKEVVILGPEHNASGAAVKTSLAVWETPFGPIFPGKETIGLISNKDNVLIDNEAHLNEWSVNTLFPYIKYVFPEAVVVPILVNNNISSRQIKNLSDKLAARAAGDNTLFILSSDFVHKLSLAESDKADALAIQEIASLREEKIDSLILDARGGLKLFLAIMKKVGVASGQLAARSDNYQETQKHQEFEPYPYLVTYQTWFFSQEH